MWETAAHRAERGELKGVNGVLLLTEEGVTLRRGWRGRFWGLRDNVRARYVDLRGVRFQRAGVAPGFLQLMMDEDSFELTPRLAFRHPTTIVFGWLDNGYFEKARAALEMRVRPQD